MTQIKLLNTGGYVGLEAAVGKTFPANKILGHWNILGSELAKAGCNTCMYDYAFLPTEVEKSYGLCTHYN